MCVRGCLSALKIQRIFHLAFIIIYVNNINIFINRLIRDFRDYVEKKNKENI